MLEIAEITAKVSRSEYCSQSMHLRSELIQAQQTQRTAQSGIVIVIAGNDWVARHEIINLLWEWLDPRNVSVHAGTSPESEDHLIVPMAQWWMKLPAAGNIAIFTPGWTAAPLKSHLERNRKSARLLEEHGKRFESMLAAEGTRFVKIWLHASGKRLKKLMHLKASEGPGSTPLDRKMLAHPERARKATERFLSGTDHTAAPWHIIQSSDHRIRDLAIARMVLGALQKPDPIAVVRKPAAPLAKLPKTILDSVDLSAAMTDDEYGVALEHWQTRLRALTREAQKRGISSVLALEGWDAAGKGGVIRRLASAVDANLIRVVPIAAPNAQERAYHWLWRFWKSLPPMGRTTIFDRTWYGRVLVERVEGFCPPEAWQRAYNEIKDFEEQLTDHGLVLIKCWLHISPAMQLTRFKERETVAYKNYKIGPDDWRNRKRWNDYALAVHEMVERTSTSDVPWQLVAANNKLHARITILKTWAKALEKRLKI